MKKITFTNIILSMLILFISTLYISSFSDKKELEKEIATLESDLKKEKQVATIYDRTNEFIQSSSEAEHGNLLTGQAKKEFQKALEEHGKEEDNHYKNTIDHVEIINIFALKTNENEYKSYAVYRVFYNNNPDTNEITTQRIVDLTLIADWEKENGEFKVFKYKIDILKDSIDEYLKELE